MNINLMPGDTVFYRNIPVFTSKVQQWVLGSDLSHSSYIAGLFDESVMELEADIKVRIHTFLKKTNDEINPKHRQIFRYNPELINQDIVLEVLREIRFEFEDRFYGFIQWPTIAIRTMFERLGFKSARGWNILWGWGISCSELLYEGEKRIWQRNFQMNRNPRLQEALFDLYHYNKDTFTPEDLRKIYYKFPMIKKDVTENELS